MQAADDGAPGKPSAHHRVWLDEPDVPYRWSLPHWPEWSRHPASLARGCGR
jgi:hypothetical protein